MSQNGVIVHFPTKCDRFLALKHINDTDEYADNVVDFVIMNGNRNEESTTDDVVIFNSDVYRFGDYTNGKGVMV